MECVTRVQIFICGALLMFWVLLPSWLWCCSDYGQKSLLVITYYIDFHWTSANMLKYSYLSIFIDRSIFERLFPVFPTVVNYRAVIYLDCSDVQRSRLSGDRSAQ